MTSRMLTASFAAAFVAMAAGQVWISHLRNNLASDIQQQQQQQAELRQEVQRLQIELASLTRPERLRAMARDKLGMQPPLPAQVIKP